MNLNYTNYQYSTSASISTSGDIPNVYWQEFTWFLILFLPFHQCLFLYSTIIAIQGLHRFFFFAETVSAVYRFVYQYTTSPSISTSRDISLNVYSQAFTWFFIFYLPFLPTLLSLFYYYRHSGSLSVLFFAETFRFVY